MDNNGKENFNEENISVNKQNDHGVLKMNFVKILDFTIHNQNEKMETQEK